MTKEYADICQRFFLLYKHAKDKSLFNKSALELLSGLERWIFSTHSESADCLSGLHADSDQLD